MGVAFRCIWVLRNALRRCIENAVKFGGVDLISAV